MKFQDKLYNLRRGRGLSQERLAEELGVSRQAVSKWEGGAAIPESDKLIAISSFFGVSVDYLIKDGIDSPDTAPAPPVGRDKLKRRLGLGLLILGVLLIIAWGVLIAVLPDASEGVAGSSVITLDGRVILPALFAALVAAGLIILLEVKK